MAIKRIKFDQLEGTVTITNGDFQALKKIARDYNITNEEDVITFAIGVLSEANGRPVAVEKVDGTIAKFLPAEKLKTNQ